MTKCVSRVLQALVLTMSVLLCSPEFHAEQTPKFDGHWWLLLTSEEKSGYLNGDADCRRFELKARPRYKRMDVETQEEVTNFYRNNRGKRSLPVFDVIRIVEDQPPLRSLPEGGEIWKEPHGYFDGEWWSGGVRVDRLGFVEGYMACYARSPKPHGRFSKTPDDYVRLIDGWYKFNEEEGQIDIHRVDAKIADVLFKFTDQEQRTESKDQ